MRVGQSNLVPGLAQISHRLNFINGFPGQRLREVFCNKKNKNYGKNIKRKHAGGMYKFQAIK